MLTFEHISSSPDDTIQYGRQIGQQLQGAEVFAVCGPLGSGKTHLIKGVAQGCGYEQQDQINSPTFVLVNEYTGRFLIYHIDAYRLDKPQEFEMLGFTDLLHPGAVVLIEWADKVLACLQGINTIQVELEHRGPQQRYIQIKNAPSYLQLPSQ